MTSYIKMPKFERQYTKGLRKLLDDREIHAVNRELFRLFFERESYKLKRINSRQTLDEASYKTLCYYLTRFRNVNRWFNNKPLTDITKSDIKRVYDDLEEGRILTQRGQPVVSRVDYYNKIFKSHLFKLAGKDQLAREVIEFVRPNRQEVRFISEKNFRALTRRVRQPRNLLLFWLAWDYGENIGALIQLVPEDFHRQIDPDTGEPEYRLNFRREILKRSRRPRSELSNYPETVDLLDDILPTIAPGQPIFTFGYAYAKKIIERARKSSKIFCQPAGDRVTWKVLRSSMACRLLTLGWSGEEVNARLGHKPSSVELDKYINFLAIDRRRPKQKVAEYQARQQERGRRVDRNQNTTGILYDPAMADQIAAIKESLMQELRAEFEAAARKEAA